MKKIKYLLCYILAHSFLFSTFSIVAVDTTTGEVGSAGGSCIAGSIIISDIHPGIGAIHTQSYYLSANQNYASMLMDQGYSSLGCWPCTEKTAAGGEERSGRWVGTSKDECGIHTSFVAIEETEEKSA